MRRNKTVLTFAGLGGRARGSHWAHTEVGPGGVETLGAPAAHVGRLAFVDVVAGRAGVAPVASRARTGIGTGGVCTQGAIWAGARRALVNIWAGTRGEWGRKQRYIYIWDERVKVARGKQIARFVTRSSN